MCCSSNLCSLAEILLSSMLKSPALPPWLLECLKLGWHCGNLKSGNKSLPAMKNTPWTRRDALTGVLENAHAKLNQLCMSQSSFTPTKFHVSHSHLFQVWVFSVSLPQSSQECAALLCTCRSHLDWLHCCPEFPIHHQLCLPLAPQHSRPQSASLLAQTHSLRTGFHPSVTCYEQKDSYWLWQLLPFRPRPSYLPISLVSVWFSFYVEFKPEMHSAQTVKSQPYSPLPWLIRFHIILIHKKLLQRWIHSIQAFLLIYPGALWSCGSLYLIMGAEWGSYRISWCTSLRSGISFCAGEGECNSWKHSSLILIHCKCKSKFTFNRFSLSMHE